MDREPAGAEDVRRGPAVSRSLLAAVVVVVLALVAVIVVLATRLGAAPGTASGLAATPRPSTSANPTVATIYQRLRPSVVVVSTGHDFGSGVIVSNTGTILTADHVVAGASSITVVYFDGTEAKATVISADPADDTAMLAPATLPTVLVPAALGGGAGVGTPVVAIGNPLGLEDSVSAGVVSGLDRTATTSDGTFSGLIQFDASVNPGSSGGPLLNAQGYVVGIVVSIADPGHDDAFAGIGFAEPIGAALGGSARRPQI